MHSRAEQPFFVVSLHTCSIFGNWLTVTSFCSWPFRDSMMMFLCPMHHQLQAQRVAIKLLWVHLDNDNVKMMKRKNKKQQHIKTSSIGHSQFASFPKRRMIVRSVVVLPSSKTRHVIIEECTQSLMTQTVLGLDSIKMKSNKSHMRLHHLKNRYWQPQ